MFSFVIEVIAVSIIISLIATWFKLIPKHAKWKYRLIQQGSNLVMLNIILTAFFIFEFYPSWVILAIMIFLVLWLSVELTDYIVKKNEIVGWISLQNFTWQNNYRNVFSQQHFQIVAAKIPLIYAENWCTLFLILNN